MYNKAAEWVREPYVCGAGRVDLCNHSPKSDLYRSRFTPSPAALKHDKIRCEEVARAHFNPTPLPPSVSARFSSLSPLFHPPLSNLSQPQPTSSP